MGKAGYIALGGVALVTLLLVMFGGKLFGKVADTGITGNADNGASDTGTSLLGNTSTSRGIDQSFGDWLAKRQAEGWKF